MDELLSSYVTYILEFIIKCKLGYIPYIAEVLALANDCIYVNVDTLINSVIYFIELNLYLTKSKINRGCHKITEIGAALRR